MGIETAWKSSSAESSPATRRPLPDVMGIATECLHSRVENSFIARRPLPDVKTARSEITAHAPRRKVVASAFIPTTLSSNRERKRGLTRAGAPAIESHLGRAACEPGAGRVVFLTFARAVSHRQRGPSPRMARVHRDPRS